MSHTGAGLVIFALYPVGMVAIGLISARYQKTAFRRKYDSGTSSE